MTGNTTTQAARVAGRKGFSLISDEKFRELYAALFQCRMLDERLAISNNSAIHTYERWAGREAASAGVVACLCPGDSIIRTTRGVLAGYLHGKSPFTADAEDAAPATDLATATRAALRHKLDRTGNVAVVFSGEGEPGRMRQTFANAASQLLPVFFVMEGNETLPEVCGNVPLIRVDRSDAVALYRVAHESIARARHGAGPTIMECAAWPNDDAADSLAKLERYLAGKRLFRKAWKQRLEKNYADALNRAMHPPEGLAVYTRQTNAVA